MVVHAFPKIAAGDELPATRKMDREYISFRDVWIFLRRNFLILFLFSAVGCALGSFYVLNTPATYLATTRLVMDPEQGRVSWQDAATGTIIIETAEIASQVEIVKSEAVAQSVIRQLGLTEDPELLRSKSWQSVLHEAVSSITARFTAVRQDAEKEEVDTEAEVLRRTMAAFLARVTVQRVGQSYVLEIGYLSNNAKKSARVANALAKTYIRVGMDDRADMAKSGAKWLESRLIEVGRQARQASVDAEEFRSKNNITVVSSQSTLDQQQLSEVSTQLLAARSATAAEAAKLSTLQQALATTQPDDHFADVNLDSEAQKLREDIRQAETRLENLKSRYDEGSPAIAAAEGEIDRLKDALQGEFRRVEKAYRANLEAAQTREKLAEARLASLTGTTATKNSALAELAEIESRANTYRRIYESLLQQLVSTVQTQSFPLGKARVVTAATAPLSKTWPKTSIILPFSTSIGLMFGMLVSVFRQNMARRSNSSEHLRRELGINVLGHVPVYQVGKDSKIPGAEIPKSMAPLRGVLDVPYSAFAEALRCVKNSIDSIYPDNASVAIGITSVGDGEGKTTIAVNLAQLYRNEGRSVLLVDADFVSARLSRMATVFPKDLALAGMDTSELLGTVEDAPARTKRRTGETAVISRSTASTRPVPHEVAMVHSGAAVPVFTTAHIKERTTPHQHYGHLPALRKGLDMLRKHYEVIIVDMSAFEGSADTRVICTYLDGIVVVLGRSSRMTIDRLSNALASLGKSRIMLLGSISNRSNR
jgi:succinoglycan biosynthesis transport protein ExoP